MPLYLLIDLEAAGLAIRAEGGRLLVSPTSAITTELRERIVARKDALLAALADQEEADGILWPEHPSKNYAANRLRHVI